jgi:hypothetical protein
MKGRSIELLKVKNLSLYRSPICQVHEEPAKLEALLQQGPEWERLLALGGRHRASTNIIKPYNATQQE